GSGQIHTSCQAGGMTSDLIRASVAGSFTGADDGRRYRNPRPQRRRLIPGSEGSLRDSSPAAADVMSPYFPAGQGQTAPRPTRRWRWRRWPGRLSARQVGRVTWRRGSRVMTAQLAEGGGG